MLAVGVLGPLVMSLDGRPVAVTAPKHRALLALMILHRNTPLRIDRVLAELWDGDPPDSAVDNVRTYVSALRRQFGSYRDRLITRHGSYLLRACDDDVDAAVFARQTDDAEQAAATGDWARAEDGYGHALELWRGDPLADVPTGPHLSAYAVSLRESHCRTLESYLLSRARTGHADQAIVGLRRLVADHPSRESSWHALISALHEAGDRAAALDAYQRARASLAERLGLDPSAELTALHARLLNGSPPAAVAAPGVATTCVMRPRQLPPAPACLVGRERELAWLRSQLSAAEDADIDGAPRVVAIYGMCGVGKSSLAVTVAHAIGHSYPDGQLYIDLQGASPGMQPVAPVEALHRLSRAFGAAADQLSPNLADAAALFRSYAADRRILLILDNALDAAQVRSLLPATAKSAVLITSRRRLDTLDGADHHRIDTLHSADAITLLGTLTSPDVVGRDASAAAELAGLCGNLPLAIRIIGLRASRYGFPDLRAITRRLRHERSLLDELGHADLSVRATFEAGYRWMIRESRHGELAAGVFRLLGSIAPPSFGSAEVAALAQLDEPTAERVLDLLADHGLAEQWCRSEVRGTQWRMHDLVRCYARELAEQTDSPEVLRGARVRLAQWFIAVVRNSPALYEIADGDTPHETDLAGDPRVPATVAQAELWLEHYAPALARLSRDLHADPRTRVVAWQLLRPLTMRLAHSFPATCVLLHEPLAELDDTGHRPELIRGLCVLSSANSFLGRYRESHRHAERAYRLLSSSEETALRARVLSVYGSALDEVGYPERSIGHHLEAVRLFQSLGRSDPVHICLISAAEDAYKLEWYQAALAMLRRSLAIGRGSREARMSWGPLLALFAKVHLRLGHTRLAVHYCTAAIERAEQQRHWLLRAHALQQRALARQALGAHAEAVADAATSLEVARAATSAEREIEALRVLGVVKLFAGDPDARDTLAAADRLAAATMAARVSSGDHGLPGSVSYPQLPQLVRPPSAVT